MTLSRRLRPLAALAIVALVGAGCSSGSAGTDDGSSGGPENATDGNKTVSFAECMRDNGVTEFPDQNASDDQEFVEAIERARDASSAAWKKAIAACKDLQPAGLLGGKATPEEMDKRLAFAQCMRDNGIKDFPDPEVDGPLIDTNRIPSAAGRGALEIPGFQAAMDACRDASAAALGDQ